MRSSKRTADSVGKISRAPVAVFARAAASAALAILGVGEIAGAGAAFAAEPSAARPAATTQANVMAEIAFTASRPHADPFNEVTLDAVFVDPAGRPSRVPAFWAGGDVWKVRYASPVVGTHRFRTECSAADDPGLGGVAGELRVDLYTGDNPLLKDGPLRVAADRRHLEHADGTPFFWLGDTWWMGLCHRLQWPDEFKKLAADRKAKGFTVVQIVAGLYPDMPPFDPRGANEAGFPWEPDFARIRPEYFDAADQRVAHLVDSGLAPCVVGAWGYFLPLMGVEKAKQHWRYLVARWGAWPVVWCVAGEANLPYYLAKGFPYDDREQVKGWTEVAASLRSLDPFHRLTTIHPTGIGRLSSRNAINDMGLLDIDMLQTPHAREEAVAPTVKTVRESYADSPVMPVINGEPCYEMLMDKIPARWPRAMFWICMLNGAAGHTYGANGIWQCNRPGQPHGNSPNGAPGGVGYGTITWEEAMNLPGSSQLAIGKRLLEQYPWQRFEPHPEWAAFAFAVAGGGGQNEESRASGAAGEGAKASSGSTIGSSGGANDPHAAGIADAVRIIWVPRPEAIVARVLNPAARWTAALVNPIDGARTELGEIRPDAAGDWRREPPEGCAEDWIVILEARE